MRVCIFIFVVTLLFTSSVQGEIYTCKNASGETIYTDSPSQCHNAEEVKVDSLPTLIPTKPVVTPTSNRSNTQPSESASAYEELVITSPIDNSAVRDNQGNLTINFRASPALQARLGHKYIISLDGKEVYDGTSTITALKNVDRGTHKITAKIVNASGEVIISSEPITVTLQRFSVLQNQANTVSDGDAGTDGDGQNSLGNNFSFPSNTQFNRPAAPPPPPSTATSGAPPALNN